MMENVFAKAQEKGKLKFTSAVFLYVFIGLAITAAVAALVGVIFRFVLPIDYTSSIDPTRQANGSIYVGVMIAATIAYFILLIWIMNATFKNKGKLVLPFVLYAVVMGILISSFTLYVRVELIATSFAITCLMFGVMFLIGWFTKRSLSIVAIIASGLFMGALFMSLFNIVWMFISPATFSVMNWIISFIILIAVMLITIVDIRRLKDIEASGEGSTNLALYCAFNLYVDFIYIFIRVLLFIGRYAGRR